MDRSEIVENIGVIELDIVDDDDFGQVVDELAALVEEGGVILIAFDDEELAVGETSALLETIGDAADEVAGVFAVVFEDPGKKGSGCPFAMGSGHNERAFA